MSLMWFNVVRKNILFCSNNTIQFLIDYYIISKFIKIVKDIFYSFLIQ